MSLSPESRALIEMTSRVGAPRFHELSVDQARRSSQKLHFAFRPEAPAVASVTDVPMGCPALLGRYYRPLGHHEDTTLPLLIFFHGGGFCVGDVASYDVLCRELANIADCAVLSVDYRLAPEHPFPAAVEDANFAFEWAVENAGLLGIDPQRIALGGDSAGGNLALVAALTQRDRPAAGLQPRFLMLIYPCTEIRSRRPSRENYARGYFLDRETLDWFFERYLPHGQAEDWRVSPMRAATLAGLPPMWVLGAEYDPLIDDCRAFVERVRAEGGEIGYCEVPGVLHGFLTLGKRFPQAAHGVAVLAWSLRMALRSSAVNTPLPGVV